MKQHILSSFVSRKGGENKAPVVLDDVGLSGAEMKYSTKISNFTETVFLHLKNQMKKFCNQILCSHIRSGYLNHTVLASFNILDELGYLKVNQFYHFNRFNSYCFT